MPIVVSKREAGCREAGSGKRDAGKREAGSGMQGSGKREAGCREAGSGKRDARKREAGSGRSLYKEERMTDKRIYKSMDIYLWIDADNKNGN